MSLFVVPLLPPSLVRFPRAPHGQATVGSARLGGLQPLDRSREAFDVARDESGLGRVKDCGDLCVAMTQASNLAMLLHWEDRSSMAHNQRRAFLSSITGRAVTAAVKR